ncbi:uncharacterized protein JCM15063_006340 [Sporobolomyces koalae]|uniref:uncharacterized protein n=1 Tax=Sporobolomyces koalae TaxID=500713 RepID=UPI003180D7A6
MGVISNSLKSERASNDATQDESITNSCDDLSLDWSLTVEPALSRTALAPGDNITLGLALAPTPDVHLDGVEVRIVGYSELTSESTLRHEFVSARHTLSGSLLERLVQSHEPTEIELKLPLEHTCMCAFEKGFGLATRLPIPPSYDSNFKRIVYQLEIVAKVIRNKDKKGKGKWSSFRHKAVTERFHIPFRVETRPVFDPRIPHPPPLAFPEHFKTQPISEEFLEGRQRVTRVALPSSEEIGLTTSFKDVELKLEITSRRMWQNRIVPSFRYTLVAPLGRHSPDLLPLVSTNVMLASCYVHFVLEKSVSTISDPTTRSIRCFRKNIPLVHLDPTHVNPIGIENRHATSLGTFDGCPEVVVEDGYVLDEERQVELRFARELQAVLPKEIPGEEYEEERFISIRTCQLEIRYDLTATFQFGTDADSCVTLKSTNLPLDLEAHEISTICGTELTVPGKIGAPVTGGAGASTARHTQDDLPAYEPPATGTSSEDVSVRPEKQESNAVSLVGSSSQNDPPAYESDDRGVGDTHHSVRAGQSEGGEGPPSWAEVVMDEPLEDWVTASAVLGTE